MPPDNDLLQCFQPGGRHSLSVGLAGSPNERLVGADKSCKLKGLCLTGVAKWMSGKKPCSSSSKAYVQRNTFHPGSVISTPYPVEHFVSDTAVGAVDTRNMKVTDRPGEKYNGQR